MLVVAAPNDDDDEEEVEYTPRFPAKHRRRNVREDIIYFVGSRSVL
jgi:hypothetical protein